MSPIFNGMKTGNVITVLPIVSVFPVDEREMVIIGTERKKCGDRLSHLSRFRGKPDDVVNL